MNKGPELGRISNVRLTIAQFENLLLTGINGLFLLQARETPITVYHHEVDRHVLREWMLGSGYPEYLHPVGYVTASETGANSISLIIYDLEPTCVTRIEVNQNDDETSWIIRTQSWEDEIKLGLAGVKTDFTVVKRDSIDNLDNKFILVMGEKIVKALREGLDNESAIWYPRPPSGCNDAEMPREPNMNDANYSRDDWFVYYHAMQKAEHKITLSEIAQKTKYSVGYVKQLHAQYIKSHEL